MFSFFSMLAAIESEESGKNQDFVERTHVLCDIVLIYHNI